jgi:DNA-binding CsgD family transcriptional regulator
MQTTSSVLLNVRAEHSEPAHTWLRTLDAFSVPFLCYAGDGRRTYTCRSAAELLRRGRDGAAIGDRADRAVGEELARKSSLLHIGQFALVREVPLVVPAMLLAVHLARPAGGDTTAVVVLRPDMGPATTDTPSICGLTARELDVARLIARGMATKEIAHWLGISTHTARHHTERVFVKLGVRSRAGAAAIIAARMATPTSSPAVTAERIPTEVRDIRAV